MRNHVLFLNTRSALFTGFMLLLCVLAGAQNPFNAFLKDSPDGETVSRYDNNDTSAYFTKVNGNVSGVVKEFYPNRRLKYVLHLEDGLCNDTAKWFLKDGRPETILFCRNDTVLYGETRTYKDSVLILKQRYQLTGADIVLKNVVSIGVEAIYIDLERTAKKQNVIYIREAWYYNKQLSEKYVLVSGKKNGEHLKNSESGKPLFKRSYNNGVKDGPFITYDKEGKELKKICYTAGKETSCN